MAKTTYSTLCEEYYAFSKKVFTTLIETLNNRGCTYVDVMDYVEKEIVQLYDFPRTDGNGYSQTTYIKTIRKGEHGSWIAELVDAGYNDWDDVEITDYNFGVGELIDILGLVTEIFHHEGNTEDE